METPTSERPPGAASPIVTPSSDAPQSDTSPTVTPPTVTPGIVPTDTTVRTRVPVEFFRPELSGSLQMFARSFAIWLVPAFLSYLVWRAGTDLSLPVVLDWARWPLIVG